SSVPPGSDQVANEVMRYEATLDDARGTYNPFFPGRVVPFLTEAARMLERVSGTLAGSAPDGDDLAFHIEQESGQLQAAILEAARVEIDAIAADETVVPRQTFELQLQVWNGGETPARLHALEPLLPDGWAVTSDDPVPGEI